MMLQPATAALALSASFAAQAFSCAPTGNLECRLELSTLSIVFDAGVYNFNGDSQFNGSDGSVTGYTAGAGQFPELIAVDSAGGMRAGFSFAPNMAAGVGGSGISGNHEATASFSFDNLQFIARPGYRVDGVEFSVSGYRSQVGNGWAWIGVPGIPVYNGDQFSASHVYAPDTASYAASFGASATYLEGEDGTAAAYGTASVAFTAAGLVARVSAVPEPPAWCLWLPAGALLATAGWRRRRGGPAA